MVGLVPLFAVHVLMPPESADLDRFVARARDFLERRPSLLKNVAPVGVPGDGPSQLLAVLGTERLEAVLRRMLDPAEFLSDYGIRSVSRHHLAHPYVFTAAGQQFEVKYLPAESDNRLFGGNSNWPGPIWFPVNYLIVRPFHHFCRYTGARL